MSGNDIHHDQKDIHHDQKDIHRDQKDTAYDQMNLPPECPACVEHPEKDHSAYQCYGRYAFLREHCLDYAFHQHYPKERQCLQEGIITKELDGKKKFSNKKIILTAGGIGCGKDHTVKKLLGRDYRDFVVADVDKIKHALPEMAELLKIHPKVVGKLLHNEACTIHEIMFKAAIQQGLNVIIDGSLRNGEFFLPLIRKWRECTSYEIVVIHVVAPLEVCIQRATKREHVTKRHVPNECIQRSIEESPFSVHLLAPWVHRIQTINNEKQDN